MHVVAGVFGVPPLLLTHSAETYEHSVSTDCAVQLSCSRASELDDARRRTLAAMVEGAAGTVGGRSGPTAGRVDGAETRNLQCEGYAREEIHDD